MRITLVIAGSIALAGAIFPVLRALGQVNLPEGFEIVEFGFSEYKPGVPILWVVDGHTFEDGAAGSALQLDNAAMGRSVASR